jgi:hypothetical protein
MEKQQSFEHEDVVAKSQDPSLNAVDDYVPGTDAEKRLVRKIDLYLLPCMWFMYLLSYMDRTK